MKQRFYLHGLAAAAGIALGAWAAEGKSLTT